MPELDLVAYLDGEADAATAQRLAAVLATDPRLRQEVLALLRQRVALQRVLADMPRERTVRPRRWWILATGLAAAAALIVAFLPRTGGGAPTSGPAVATAPAPTADPLPLARLSDGGAWRAGERIAASGALLAELADGGRIELAAGSVLLVPRAGATWQLERGVLHGTAPAAGGFQLVTGQARIALAGGAVRVEADADGTVIAVRHGRVEVTDLLTRATATLAADARYWIPADTQAPQAAAGAPGRIRGTVVAVRPAAGTRQLVLRTRFGELTFVPPWLARPAGPDRRLVERLEQLHPGDRVDIAWHWSEHLRVTEVRMIGAGEAGPKPASQDF